VVGALDIVTVVEEYPCSGVLTHSWDRCGFAAGPEVPHAGGIPIYIPQQAMDFTSPDTSALFTLNVRNNKPPSSPASFDHASDVLGKDKGALGATFHCRVLTSRSCGAEGSAENMTEPGPSQGRARQIPLAVVVQLRPG
jgi:hypothetical protein